MQRLLVLGGNGYVGQNICRAALDSGKYAVASFSRSGPPSTPNPCLTANSHLMDEIEWMKGDIFDVARRDEAFGGVDVIISTIGAFGNNEYMEKICGDATVDAVESAAKHKVKQFGFISSAQVGKTTEFSSSMPLYGYFRGKAKAEEAIKRLFPHSHVIARPGFIYGPRVAGAIGTLPLQLVGAPINFISTRCGPISSVIQAVPFLGTEASSMVPVGCVGDAMIKTLLDKNGDGACTLSAEKIRKFA